MKNKKLALLLGKLPEDRKEAFVADMKSAGPDGYAKVIAQYGIALTDDEKAFLTSDVMTAIGDAEMESMKGGAKWMPCLAICQASCSSC